MSQEKSEEAPRKERSVPPGAARRLVVLFGVAALLVGADWWSKKWALEHLSRARGGEQAAACTEPGRLSRARLEPVVLIENHVSLEYTENCGGAFGLLSDTSESVRYPFFVIMSLIALGFIVGVYRRLEPHQRLLGWALPAVLGGALGNFYDRLAYRYVVDFIKVQASPEWVWPTFNVADAAITVGVVLMFLDMFPRRQRAQAPGVSAREPAPNAGSASEAAGPSSSGDAA